MTSGNTVTGIWSVPSRPRWAVERPFPRRGSAEEASGTRLTMAAGAVGPGDYLPPQPRLDPTAWQDSGFQVGTSAQDVCRAPMRPSRVLLFGPLGVLDVLAEDAEVTVVRAGASPT